MSETGPTLQSWPGPAEVSDIMPGVSVYDAARLASWKGLRFLVADDPDIEGGRALAEIKAPYVPGQIVHDMGREPWVVTIVTLWAGDGWRDRLYDFVYEIDTNGRLSGELCLPDGGWTLSRMHVKSWKLPQSLSRESGTLTVTWVEDQRLDAASVYTASSQGSLSSDVPDGDTTTSAAVTEIASVMADPDSSDAALRVAIAAGFAVIAEQRLAQPLDTVAGVEADEGYALTMGRIIAALGDPETYLGGA